MFGFFKRLFSQPASVPAMPAPESQPAPPPEEEAIHVPFSDIVARMSGALAPLAPASVTGAFALPVKTALAQLPSGAVRVRFAQLRQAAPPGTFADDATFDETLVDLPLPKILPALNPALLSRRAGQAQVEVPKEMSGVFGSKDRTPVPVPAPTAPPVLEAPASSPVAPKPSAAQFGEATVTVRLSALYEFWPAPVRQEIAQSNWNDVSVLLPLNRLDTALKTGRVIFTWGELIQWFDVSPGSVSSPHLESSVELPLKVIAPLFISQRSASVVQKKIAVGENIPNLFSSPAKSVWQAAPEPMRAPVSAPAPSPVPAAPAPTPVPIIPVRVHAPAPVSEAVTESPREIVPPLPAAATAPVNVLGEVFGQSAKNEWSPQEITQQVNALPGVAASLIAMSDGLLVAGDLPAPLKSETVAAFLPQMFGRQAHYSSEIQLGSLTALTLLAGQNRYAIFKTGALYLAVLSKPGAPLPDALLQRVAGELAKLNR